MANDDEAIACGPLAQFMNALTDPFERRMVAAYIDGGTDGLEAAFDIDDPPPEKGAKIDAPHAD